MRKSLHSLWLIAILLMLLPTSALAHTGVKTSSPAKGDVVTTPLTQLELTFNTVIEPLSSLIVTNEAGEEVPVTVEIGKDSMKGVLEQPLVSGTYTVKWRIIGEDGHNVDGDYTFKVERQAEETPMAPSEPTASAVGETGAAAPDQEAAASGQTNAAEGSNVSTPTPDEQPQAAVDNRDADTAVTQQAESGADETSGGTINGTTIMWVIFGVLLLGGFVFGVVRIASKS
ncbi:copper resistance CopC family protein [Paenibacillus xanthanilyticus]|uniref:Copper resistance protein CopC n=1 Tax=Paenibacillus xanthanilyticus TaxID=1783531 RepID=A0ABV8K619_9BACL